MKKSTLIKIFVITIAIVLTLGLSACSKKNDDPVTPPAHTHTVVTDEAVAPTCTTSGMTQGSHCSTCNTVLVAQNEIPANGHSIVDEIVLEASCASVGIKKYTCTVPSCNYSHSDTYSLPTYPATELYSQAVKYVGEIVTYDRSGAEYALGTGFVISSDGKIVTNYHVIEGAYSAEITINNVTYTIASVLAYDANIDLAVLKINATGLTAANICKRPVNVGETVYAIGSSRGMTNTYSQGIITYADRIVDGVSHIQHDASITHGNSGGPLINVYGEVIGINTWGISDSQNLNFAVFTDELDNLVYGTPITLSQLYEQNMSAYDVLVAWLIDNYNYSTDDTIRYEYQSSGGASILSLAYDFENDYLFIDVITALDGGATAFLLIDLSFDPSEYVYFATYEYSGNRNTTRGRINAITFTDSTVLSYTSFEGYEGAEDLIMDVHQSHMCYLIEWLDLLLDWQYANTGIDISDLGFEAWNN